MSNRCRLSTLMARRFSLACKRTILEDVRFHVVAFRQKRATMNTKTEVLERDDRFGGGVSQFL